MKENFAWQQEKVKLFASSAEEAIISLRTVWEVNTHTGERRGRSDCFQRRGLAVKIFKILKMWFEICSDSNKNNWENELPCIPSLPRPLYPCCWRPGFLFHWSSRKSDVSRTWRLFSKIIVCKKFSPWKQGVSRNSVARHPQCISVN